jgi:hypothetical protein
MANHGKKFRKANEAIQKRPYGLGEAVRLAKSNAFA